MTAANPYDLGKNVNLNMLTLSYGNSLQMVCV